MYFFKKKDGFLFKNFSVALCCCLLLNSIFTPRVYAADAATYRTGLAPLETLVAAVVIGSGIVAGQSKQAVDALVSSVSKIIKDNTVRKAEEDPAFQSPYRVIQGGGGSGSDPTPEEPNNNNKNGRWFGIVGASSLGSALLFEKGAVEEIMQTIKEQNGYNSVTSDIGVVSADDFKTQSTSGQIALQLANLGGSALSQFNDFLNSSYWDSAPFDKNNCWFAVSTFVPHILQGEYPKMQIVVMEKSDDVKFLRLKNRLSYYTYSDNNGSLSYYGFANATSDYDNPYFLGAYEVNTSVKQQIVSIPDRDPSSSFSFDAGNIVSSNHVMLNPPNSYKFAYCGYKWVHQNDWGFTNNVYNSNQTFNTNFPDWLQQSITLLGKQIDAVNLGLQNLSKINWAQTQPQIQTAAASDAAVSQAVNNWENPGNIPEPEPNPNPDPDPDPEPQPVPEPVPDNEYLGNFLLPESITTKFPFCIPFDVARCLRLFSTSSREAPRWECDLGYGSNSYHVVIDLSMFNDVADFIRPLEYILFLVGLAVGTRALIRG